MRKLLARLARLLAGAALVAACGTMAQMPSVPGEPALVPKGVAVAQLRLAQEAPKVVLSPITDSELAGMRQANRRNTKRLVIGAVREPDSRPALPTAPSRSW